ncbi:MAG: hypothetical protein ACLTR4_07840 [Gallintestinimicrobium sp.]
MKNRKKQDNATAQSAIYVGFVDTPGLFASIIRRVIGQNYVHVVLGFDPELKEALQHRQTQSGDSAVCRL